MFIFDVADRGTNLVFATVASSATHLASEFGFRWPYGGENRFGFRRAMWAAFLTALARMPMTAKLAA
jgi:hypothetical protein